MVSNKTKDGKIRAPRVATGGSFGFEEQEKIRICQNIADVVGFIKNAKINVKHGDYYGTGVTHESLGEDDKQHIVISVNKTENRTSKTDMEDSVAHVLFPSAKIAYEKLKGEIIGFGNENHLQQLGNLSDQVFDALEKARVKSCMSVPYKGYADRSTESNLKDGKIIQVIDDPVKALHAAQLGLEDLVKASDFPSAWDSVQAMERVGNKATVIATNEYMNTTVKPWYQLIEDENKPEDQPEGGEGPQGGDQGGNQGQGNPSPTGGEGEEGEGEGDEQNPQGDGSTPDPAPDSKQPKWKSQPVSEPQKRYIKKLGGDPSIPDTKGEASDMIKKLLNDEPTPEQPVQEPETDPTKEKLYKTWTDNSGNSPRQIGGGCDPTIDLDCDTVAQQQDEGEQEIEKIEDKISEFLQQEDPVQTDHLTQSDIEHKFKKGAEVKLSDHNTSEVHVNMGVVNKLKPLFKRLKDKQTSEADSTGSDIDVDLYIKNQVEGGTDFLLEDKEERGFAVVIGVDESGSMGGSNIEAARTLCGTLYKSFEDMPNVDIYVFGWTTGVGGLAIKKIEKFSEVGKLQATGGTPFLEATYYCANFADKLPHKKKLLFQITDGDVYADNHLNKYFEKLRKSKMEVTGIQIGYGMSNEMRDLFGKKNYIHTQDMNGANSQITKTIVQKFARCIG
jgi:hypothetical protein